MTTTRPIARLASILLGLMVLLTGAQSLLARAPEPDPVPRRWQFDVEFGDLKLAKVGGKQYLLLTYKVTNNTGQDLLFAPSFEIAGADEMAVRRSGRSVPAAVTSTLLKQIGDPLLEDQIGIIGMLQRGPENARRGLVVWPVESARPGAITVFAAGFSGETAIVPLPGPVTDKGEQPKATLRKTQMRLYADVGDLGLKGEGPIPFEEARWVMR